MLCYKCRFEGVSSTNQYEELIKEFLRPDEYELADKDDVGIFTYDFNGDRDEVKRAVYRDLEQITGKTPKWGILTGIRPVKLAGEIYDDFIKKHPGAEETEAVSHVGRILEEKYLLNNKKSVLVTDILEFQRECIGRPERNSVSVYAGIPFCPTRCLYCSFTSNQAGETEIASYLDALCHEIKVTGELLHNDGLNVESIYIGGGTPTTLDAGQLDRLLMDMENAFGGGALLKEFTVEAGRPDTITMEKLQVIKEHGVDRISINPQSMKQETLDLIGRKHTVDEIRECYRLADAADIKIVNTDLIAGLPGESPEDFAGSLKEIIDLGAENITVHTLAVKRASRLKEMDEEFNYRNEDICEQMLTQAHYILGNAGYRPYYLYRQKHTSGNTENTGFCRDGAASVYNIRIMEEAQSILALGAGGISKIYFPDENRLERVPNVSNYEIYIERLDEMIERKKKGFFQNAYKCT